MTKKRRKQVLAILVINLVLVGIVLLSLSVYGKLIYLESSYLIKSLVSDEIKNSKKVSAALPDEVKRGDRIELKNVLDIPEPINKDFSVVIPKIDVNHPVVRNVDINNPEEVQTALSEGLGWARGTVEPGDLGNSLIFSHSTQNVWDIFRYNSMFTLLDKLEVDDMFSIVYQGRQMDFVIYEKTVVYPNDTSYVSPIATKDKTVTLQTCHPAGSDAYRLLVRGQLVAKEIKKIKS